MLIIAVIKYVMIIQINITFGITPWIFNSNLKKDGFDVGIVLSFCILSYFYDSVN